MSILSTAGLEEYARQCSVQRRRYEDCLQQARQSASSREAAQTESANQAVEIRETRQTTQAERCTEESCMIELLELPIDPFCWNDSDSVLDEARDAVCEEGQWQHDPSQEAHQDVTHPIGKSARTMSYSAP